MISYKKLKEYFDKRKMGFIQFPTINEDGDKLSVDLKEVYKLVLDWSINGEKIKADDIMAIIVFGSSVMDQERTEVLTRKKYIFFGPDIEYTKSTIHYPNDVDFLVITRTNMTRDIVVKPEYSYYYDGWSLKSAGIHIIQRGFTQFDNGLKSDDTISQSAIKHGVRLVADSFMDVYKWETKFECHWTEDSEDNLSCIIKSINEQNK